MSNFWDICRITFGILFLLLMVGLIIALIGLCIDTISLKNVGNERTTCYDYNNHLILNMTCQKNITCSNWGLAGNIKCKKYEEQSKLKIVWD